MAATKIHAFSLTHSVNQADSFFSATVRLAEVTEGKLIISSEVPPRVSEIDKDEVYSRLLAMKLKELGRRGIPVMECDCEDLHTVNGLLMGGINSIAGKARGKERKFVEAVGFQMFRHLNMARARHMLDYTNQQLETREGHCAVIVAGAMHVEDIVGIAQNVRIGRLSPAEPELLTSLRRSEELAAKYPVSSQAISEFLGNAVQHLGEIAKDGAVNLHGVLKFGSDFMFHLGEFVNALKAEMKIS